MRVSMFCASSVMTSSLHPAVSREPVALDIPPNWTPTPANINALPDPLRQHIHDLKPSATRLVMSPRCFGLRVENKLLRWECERLAATIDWRRAVTVPRCGLAVLEQ